MNGDAALQQAHALAQAHQPERQGLARRGRQKTEAVVSHVQRHGRGAELNAHLRMRGLGVLGNIDERLLHDAEKSGGVGLFKLKVVSHLQRAGHARALRETLHQPFERRDQPEVVEQQRTQISGNAPRCGQCVVQHGDHAAETGRDFRRGVSVSEPVAHPDGVHLQRRQRLRQIVVQLTRDPGFFTLADVVGLGGEGAQLRLRAHALADVAQDHGEQFSGFGF